MFAKPASPRLQAAHPLALGLVGAWLFTDNTGTLVLDRSRNSPTNGVTSGGPTWASNLLGPVLSFNGTSHYVGLFSNVAPASIPPGLANIAAANTGYSCVAWMKSSSSASIVGTAPWSVGAPMIEMRTTGTPTSFRAWSFGLESGKITVGRANDGNGGMQVSGATSVNDSVLRQIAAVVDVNAVTLYNNGKSDGTGTFTSGGSATGNCNVGSGNANIYSQLGARSTNAAAITNFFPGHMDSLLVYNRVLNDQEIKQLYADPYAAFRPPTRIRSFGLVSAPPPSTAKQYAVSMCA